MRDATDFVIPAAYWPPLSTAGGFALNTNPLETNLINSGVVLALLVYLGRGVLSNLLNNRERTILNAIRDAEDRYKEAADRLDQARARLLRARVRADDIRMNGLSRVQRAKRDPANAADGDLERLEESKNATIRFEEQRAIEQVRQQAARLALERALKASDIRSNNEVHSHTIEHHIGLLKGMVENNR
uniref:ATP synthase subunit b, chloroplastic n=1 Tax=Selaginella doederleinii TaxID=186426 RepID=A0A482CGL1_9TRAC|nr:ATP synthase CF0 subunit I [Selaginella doederleinii]QBL76016.1 ATP synthase CF0 subunit I [Selaginella doederleinii]